MKILVATEKPFAAVAVEGIRKEVEQAGHELVLLEKGTKDDLVKAVADVDGLIVRSDIVDTTVLDAAKNLKVIVRAGAGVDNIDLQAAKAAGICVMNTPGQNSNAVAELVCHDDSQPIQRNVRNRVERQDSRHPRIRSGGPQRGTHSQRFRYGGFRP